jgi:acetyltransferase
MMAATTSEKVPTNSTSAGSKGAATVSSPAGAKSNPGAASSNPAPFLTNAAPASGNPAPAPNNAASVSSNPAPASNNPAQPHRKNSLDAIFAPRSVAVIGATEAPNSVGRTLLANLIQTPFGGTVYPVNPKRPNVLGIRAYPRVKDIPERVDLVVIVTPAASVPGVVAECVDAGVRAAIIISAGFKELGASGAQLEQRVLEEARRSGMRIIGPNCLGVMNPLTGFNATFAKGIARPGNIAFISQSGALPTAILDWSLREQVGFSSFVSAGSMLDVSWGDLIDYFGNDHKTKAILIYMESIGDARSFLSAAREVALTKPIIVIKPGRTEQAAKAAASHTGSLTGGDDVIDAAFRRCGVLRVNNISDLFYMAEILARQPRPRGPRLTIITNAGGPGVLATDALITTGGELATVSPETMQQLNALLPPAWSHNNPIDVLGDAGADRYAKTLEIVAQDPQSDGMLVILTPQDMTNPTQTAELLRQTDSRELDGRRGYRRRRRNSQPRRHPDVFVSGHRRSHVHVSLAIFLQPARPVRNAGKSLRRRREFSGSPRGDEADRNRSRRR